MVEAFLSTDINTEDNLIFDISIPRKKRTVTLLTGNVVTRGTVLGRVTASGKYIASLAAASDGSQLLGKAVIADQDRDATAADLKIIVYETGHFNQLEMDFGTHDPDTEAVRESLRGIGIFYDKAVEAF